MKSDYVTSAVKRLVKNGMRRVSCWKNIIRDPLPKLLVLVYHRVLPLGNDDGLGIIMSEKIFTRQLDYLAIKYPIITFGEAMRQSRLGQPNSRVQILLTFDDGYRDNYEVVFPILKKKGLPAAFYIPTDYIGADKPLWEVEIITGICRSPSIDKVAIGGAVIQKRWFETRFSFALRLFESMKCLKRETLKGALDTVRDRIESAKTHDYTSDLCMKWEEVSEMGRKGMEIGAHGVTHRSLARIAPADAAQEIMESKRTVEGKANVRCESFAFPFGSSKDYNPALIDRVKEAGFTTCMLNIHGYNRPDPALFAFKRIIMDEFTNLNCLIG